MPGLGACLLALRLKYEVRGHRCPKLQSRPDAVGGVARRRWGRKDAGRARPLSLPFLQGLFLWPEGELSSQKGEHKTQVKERGAGGLSSLSPLLLPWPLAPPHTMNSLLRICIL